MHPSERIYTETGPQTTAVNAVGGMIVQAVQLAGLRS